ncbi:MAG: ABC transporter ATP-binding protein [Planctomycetes bacterium]|nr:ABC transporter ATP-binding protein [Planctomycetota bacterium]
MLFELQNVSKCYGETVALDIDSLQIEPASIVGFTGPNGAGKSTLLQIFAGLMAPTSGTVTFDGKPMYPNGGLEAMRKRVTYLAQNPVLFQMSVRRNVAYGLKLRGTPRTERRRAAEEALDTVGLLHLAHRGGHQLSAGERQRIALARAICLRPDVLILDEPTANVDREHVRVVENLIPSLLRDRGVSTILASHDERQIVRLSDRILALQSGRLVPPPFENVFEGEIQERDGAFFFVSPTAMEIEVVAHRTGKAKVAIRANEIILSAAPLKSSVRNSFRGKIASIDELPEGGVHVTVDVGLPLVAEITHHSLCEMSLAVGNEIFASFKSTGVLVF